MSYTRVNWQNKPSTATPINATNLNTMDAGIAALDTAMADKVDKVAGKGLSTEDFTTEEKTKLANIEDGAEVNVQADWDEADNTADDYIKNKPDLSVYAERDELWEDATASGKLVTIKTQSAQNAESTILTMLPIQGGSGTPSPQNVRPISGRTQAEILNDGANLLDALSVSDENKYCNSTTGGYSTPSNPSTVHWRHSGLIPVISGEKYYYGVVLSGASAAGLAFYDENQSYVSGLSEQAIALANNVITIPSGVVYISFGWRIDDAYNPNWETSVYITPLNNPHAWTAYRAPQTVTIDFGQTVYGGTLDVETGELTIEYLLKTFDGTEKISQIGSNEYRFYRYTLDVQVPGTQTNVYGCSHFENKPIYTSNTNLGCHVYYSLEVQESYINIRPDIAGVTDSTTYLAWLQGQYQNGTPVQVFSKLATPTTATLTAAQVALLKGINNVSTDADSLTITYFNDGESLTDADNRITSVLGDLAKVEGATASQNYAVGDYLVFDDKFCKASRAIANGENLAIGTNLTQTTIGAELKAILAQL